MRPTIYDIARAAGVSIATVSNVLNNRGRAGVDTRNRVLKAVRELGYQPSQIASALAGKNTHTIGFLIPDVHNPYFSEILRGAEDEAFREGYSIFVCNTDHDIEKERTYVETLKQKRIDGLVIATGSIPSSIVENLLATGIRVVLFSREIEAVKVATVMVDNFRGGYLAGQHLLELGHRAIGIISEPLSIGSSKDRLNGFRAALQETDAQYYISVNGQFGISAGMKMATEILTKYSVSALFAVNDQLAVGAIQACRELGKRVPEDVSIVGFDGTVLSTVVHPRLTTIAQPIYELGRQTLSLLIKGIESNEQPTEKIVLEPELIIRESTSHRFLTCDTEGPRMLT